MNDPPVHGDAWPRGPSRRTGVTLVVQFFSMLLAVMLPTTAVPQSPAVASPDARSPAASIAQPTSASPASSTITAPGGSAETVTRPADTFPPTAIPCCAPTCGPASSRLSAFAGDLFRSK